jgi:acetolactate synthase regulatory subunit
MSSTLLVRVKKSEGSILRLLGQIGRRGYDVLGVTAKLTADRSAFDVTIEFEPFIPLAPGKPRPVEVLPSLVLKLVDVERAELKSVRLPEPPGNGSPQEPKKKAAAGKPGGELHWEE